MLDTARLDDVLAYAVASEALPGVVGIVATGDHVLYQGAYGTRDRRTEAPMSLDTVFRVASMTKVVTSLAALQLVEAGRLGLEEAVVDIVPSFAQLQVIEGFDGDRPRLRPPHQPVTVRHLLTHSSGLAYETWNEPLFRLQQLTGSANISSGRREALMTALAFDPGTGFAYGTSTDWLGLVIEAVSGTTLDAYFDTHLFKPLGLRDTGMQLSEAHRARMAAVHVRGPEGEWQATDSDNARDPEFWPGGHGLYTTAPEFVVLQQALLGDGAGPAGRLVGPGSVAALFENHLGDIEIPPFVSLIPALSATFDLGPGHTWGLGLLVNQLRRPGFRAAGSGGWAGVYNTFFWVDPASGVAAALYTQTLPFYDPDVVGCYEAFEQAVYASRGAASVGSGPAHPA